MMKRNKLYTLNRYNGPALVDRINHNIFDGYNNAAQQMNNASSSNTGYQPSWSTGNPFSPGSSAYYLYNRTAVRNGNYFNNNGAFTVQPQNYVNGYDYKTNYNDAGQKFNAIVNTAQNGLGNWKNAGMSGSGGTGGGTPEAGNMDKLGTAMGIANSAVGAFDGIKTAYSGNRPQYSADAQNGFAQLDTLLTGGKKSKLGTGLVNAGAAVMNKGGMLFHGLGALVAGVTGTAGTIINNGWGYEIENEEAVRDNTGKLKNVNFTASDNDSLVDQYNQAGIRKVGLGEVSNGVFTDEGTKQAEELSGQQDEAYEYALNSFKNAGYNIDKGFYEDYMRNYNAFGGPLDMPNDVSAVNYGFMTDYLTEKKRQNDLKNKMTGMTQMPSFMPSYALGGDLQANGSDWTTGLTHVEAGGTHEENPYEGVQMGVDREGVPNLVEEDETVYNDYVYSNRIKCDPTTKEKFHVSKKRDITFADLSKKLEKEIAERPNDPISQAAFKAQMADLAEQQERQKQEMEATRAREAFEALSPEEQTALIQQYAQQEQMAQQQAMQEQAMAEQAAAQQQPTPEEIAMAKQQQMMQADGSQAALGQAPQMACGGKINRFDKGGKKNVGAWKDKDQNHWDVFTKPGLEKYLRNLEERIKMAPDDETRDAIRKEAMNELNSLQQSYYTHVLPTVGSDQYTYSDDILNHQKHFDRLYGNTGFYTTDENGNVRNLIADAINLPKGAATDDKPDNWYDGYSGPRTSIRNFGSTEYGDDKYYQDLVDRFGKIGLTYAPNENWKYGENELYGLSIPEPPAAEERKAPQVWDWNTGSWIDKPVEVATEEPAKAVGDAAATTATGDDREVVPVHSKLENLRYAGLFGPAVGLGMQALGIGRPDTSGIEAAANIGKSPAHLASPHLIGDYMRYTPFDRLFYSNQLQANARATDRALANNSGANRGTAMAGLLANGYNINNNLGNLYRQGEEYNRAQYEKTKDFNRGTNQFNADVLNRTSQFNADAMNRGKQYNAQLAMQAAQAKMDADAGWYNGIYGNVAGLFKGLGDLGREKAQENRIADMAATGIFGTMKPGSYIANGMLRYETDEERAKRLANQKVRVTKGGKIKRKKGFTY